MAEKKKKSGALARLTPNAIDLTIDGQEVRVATSRDENAVMNMILASQGRALIQRTLKKWEEEEQTPSPKELRDIAGAMRDIASFSAEVYAAAEPIHEKPPERAAERVEEIPSDFSNLSTPPEVKDEGEPSEAGSS